MSEMEKLCSKQSASGYDSFFEQLTDFHEGTVGTLERGIENEAEPSFLEYCLVALNSLHFHSYFHRTVGSIIFSVFPLLPSLG